MNCLFLYNQACALYFYAFSLKVIKPFKIWNTFLFVLQEILILMHPTLLYKTLGNLA